MGLVAAIILMALSDLEKYAVNLNGGGMETCYEKIHYDHTSAAGYTG